MSRVEKWVFGNVWTPVSEPMRLEAARKMRDELSTEGMAFRVYTVPAPYKAYNAISDL